MKHFKIVCLSILGLLLISTVSCSEDIFISQDTNEQFLLDIKIINDYIAEKGYTDVDTTSIGVRYTVIEEGTGESIESNDIISFETLGILENAILAFNIYPVIKR